MSLDTLLSALRSTYAAYTRAGDLEPAAWAFPRSALAAAHVDALRARGLVAVPFDDEEELVLTHRALRLLDRPPRDEDGPVVCAAAAFSSTSSRPFCHFAGATEGTPLPEATTPASRQLLARIAIPDFEHHVGARERVRQAFGLGEDELVALRASPTTTVLRAPGFSFSRTITQNERYPSEAICRRELWLRAPTRVDDPRLDAAFGPLLSDIEAPLAGRVDLAALLEVLDEAGYRVPFDLEPAFVTFASRSSGEVTIDHGSLRVRFAPGTALSAMPVGLVEAVDEILAVPGGREALSSGAV